MYSRLNDIDLNSDAVFIEQDDELDEFDRYRLVAANPGISDAGTLTDRVIGSDEGDKMGLDVSDKTVVRDPELGHPARDDGATLGDTFAGQENVEDKMGLGIYDKTTVKDLGLGHAGRGDDCATLGDTSAADHEIKGRLESDLKLKGKLMEGRVEFRVNDLVWAKVMSHPWWPGQIFNPSDASEQAKRYQMGKDQLLIAFFGDQSFTWSEESRVKLFHPNFSQIEKQSCLESFYHAVDCSLEEVSRRVQFGLSCRCLPEELFNKIKTQIVVNAGIKVQSSRIEGREDNHSSPGSFAPLKLIEYARKLAVSPHKEMDRLDFVIAHSQLLAFNRWRGYYELPEFKAFEGLLDTNEHVQENSSKKRKERIHSDVSLLKKEKLVSDLMYDNRSNSSKLKIDKTNTSSGYKKKFSRLGESMRKIATQLVASSDSSLITKKSTSNIASLEEMLSQVRSAAEDPMNNKTPNSFIRFFSDFRNSVCMERSSDRIIKTKTNGDYENGTILFKPGTPTNPEMQCEQQQQHSPTALILNFTDLSRVPPVSNLNQIFSRFGPLDESETEVMKKSKRAKVIFKRRCDAETAFSSAGKYSIFGPALISYSLTPQKNCPTKRSKRVAA